MSGDRPKASRMEKQVKSLERGLLLGGLLMLTLSMGMAGKFGWGLGSDALGRVGSAAFYAGADAIGALLMTAIGVLFAWRWRTAGALVLVATAICITFSMASIFGFQSSNRTAVTLNYEASQTRADKRLDWLRNQTIDKGLAKDRQTFLAEEREQFKTMQTAEADPDTQASELATMLGIKREDAQRRLNLVGSAFILFAQFVCLSLRSFIRHRVAPAIAAQNVVDAMQFVGGKVANSTKSSAFTEDRARQDLDMLLTGGFQLDKYGAYSFLARRFGWTPNRTIRWLERQSDLASQTRRRVRKSVQSGDNHAPALNGRAHAV